MSTVILSFLRHAKVPSHEGDMPLTADSNADIEAAIPRLQGLAQNGEKFLFLATQTHRSRQTAEALREAIDPSAPEVTPAWGLRNPDVYMGGTRVEMGSKAEFFASQVWAPEISPEGVMADPFYKGFLTAPDRIEYWLTHETPPGENAAAVAKRVLQFAASFRANAKSGLVVACVTHSPVLRAILTKGLGIPDPGEPGWVEAINVTLSDTGMTYQFRDHAGTV